MVPPLLPAQVQSHGPLPITAEAAPVEHKFLVGFALIATPFAEPHDPLIFSWAAQLAAEPPFDPAQVQANGPEPVTAEAEPALHRLVVGAFVTSVPFAEPQAPLILSRAEQLAVEPPFEPAQFQLQGPVPLTAEAAPALQRPVVGTLVRPAPFDVPQLPLTAAGSTGAVQLAVVPLLLPVQLQLHGPLPLTAEAVPAEHKPLAGALLAATPLAEPQAPLPAEALSLSKWMPIIALLTKMR